MPRLINRPPPPFLPKAAGTGRMPRASGGSGSALSRHGPLALGHHEEEQGLGLGGVCSGPPVGGRVIPLEEEEGEAAVVGGPRRRKGRQRWEELGADELDDMGEEDENEEGGPGPGLPAVAGAAAAEAPVTGRGMAAAARGVARRAAAIAALVKEVRGEKSDGCIISAQACAWAWPSLISFHSSKRG